MNRSSNVAGLARLRDVPLTVTVELGDTVMTIQEVLQLGPGSLIPLDRLTGEPLDIKINGQILARGEAVIVNGKLGVRITEVVSTFHEEMDQQAG